MHVPTPPSSAASFNPFYRPWLRHEAIKRYWLHEQKDSDLVGFSIPLPNQLPRNTTRPVKVPR
jgi:hypothetical protein